MAELNIEKFYEEIKKYPPTLRRLAIYIFNSGDNSSEYKTISQYSKECGLKPDVVRVLIAVSRKKGKDFNNLLRDAYYAKLASYRPKIMKSLVREALGGSHRHQELYFKLIGDLKQDKIEPGTNITSLTYVVPMPERLPKALEPAAQQSVIEAEITPNVEEINE